MHIHGKGPVISMADHLLSASLDDWLVNWWHLKTGTNKFYICRVEDRKKSSLQTVSFEEKKLFNVKILLQLLFEEF